MSVYEKKGIPADLYTRNDESLRRFKTESLPRATAIIIEGYGFNVKWREDALPAGQSLYAEFVSPVGYYIVVNNRILNPSASNFKYKVYPGGTYTIGAEKTDDGDNFAKTEKLRVDGALEFDLIKRHLVAALPAPTDFTVYEDIYGETGGGKRDGSVSSESSVLMVGEGASFLLEMRNDGNGTMMASVEIEIGVIPSEQVPEPNT